MLPWLPICVTMVTYMCYHGYLTLFYYTQDDRGPVMLSAKNVQCMRALLSMAHCHGRVMGTGWNMLLKTLQHLTWILGLIPTDNGQLVPSPSADGANVVRFLNLHSIRFSLNYAALLSYYHMLYKPNINNTSPGKNSSTSSRPTYPV